jgi:hypothetical protein
LHTSWFFEDKGKEETDRLVEDKTEGGCERVCEEDKGEGSRDEMGHPNFVGGIGRGKHHLFVSRRNGQEIINSQSDEKMSKESTT